MDTKTQPISTVQWINRNDLFANDYNPNAVAPPELALLKISLLEDGWAAPIIARRDEKGQLHIVDGFHRWTLSKQPEVFALTNGLVPVVVLPNVDRKKAIASTIRYNRARGVHGVLKMADIVAELKGSDINMADKDIAIHLGMENEEIRRLFERGDSLQRNGQKEFNKGWIPDGTN